jgi:hypothetical protein
MAEPIKFPKFLYHYTNIESLAYILSTRKIRFSNLSKVDDVNDGKNEHFEHLKNFFFISCWTDLREESIPFWNMYTKDMCGVRIKLPSNPFIGHSMPYKDYNVDINNYENSIFPAEEVFGNDYILYPIQPLDKVKYTKDISLLNPSIISVHDDGNKAEVKFELSRYAIYKLKHWNFQSEWRYSAFALPKGVAQNHDEEGIIKFANGEYKNISKNYIYATIRADVFDHMEILLGPKQNEAQKMIIKSLVKEFCPSANVINSVLTGTIRNSL